jgi:hypothetical protein
MHMTAMKTVSARGALLALTMAIALPAMAQSDLTGRWQPRQHEDQPERGPGPELGDYLGLPINESARLFADSWDPARLTLPEHQCRVHTAPYIFRGPLNLRIWEEHHPSTQVVEKIMMYIRTYEQTRTIYMDGREHPNELAPHTWMGFSTGKWDGDALIVTTTHIKQNWVRRNGIPQSDRATLIERFQRHGDIMSHISIVEDPVYLTEPLTKSETFVMNPRIEGQAAWTYPCVAVVEVPRVQGDVPHFLPGQNANLAELSKRWNISAEVFRGGAPQMYPEYVKTHQVVERLR